MPESRPLEACKRQHSELSTHRYQDPPLHAFKRQKRYHLSDFQAPASFWDNLSEIYLTTRALQELDRRNVHLKHESQLDNSQHQCRRKSRRLLKKANPAKPVKPAEHSIHDLKPQTRQDIKRIARHGGPDLSSLKGFSVKSHSSHQVMSISRSRSRAGKGRKSSTSKDMYDASSADKTKTERTGPYDPNFRQMLVDGGIYPDGYRHPDGQFPFHPDNEEEIMQRLLRPRRSLSPSRFLKEDFERFKLAHKNARSERNVMSTVIPVIEGNVGDDTCTSGGIRLTNLDPLTKDDFVDGNPDVYYGSRPERIDRRVRDELGGHIVPSTQSHLPVAPNFFLAVKGPGGSAYVAELQACYDGALGARGMHSLQSYGKEEPVNDNNTYTITSIYHNGMLQMFSSHVARPSGSSDQTEYVMHQLNSWSMTGNIEHFRQGAIAYRNARDWTREQRETAIARANDRAKQDSLLTPPDIDLALSPVSSNARNSSRTRRSYAAQDTRHLLRETTNTSRDVADSSAGTPGLGEPLTKQPNQAKQQPRRSQRKRRDASDSGHVVVV